MLAVIAALVFVIAAVLAFVSASVLHVLLAIAIGGVFMALHAAFAWYPWRHP